MIQKHWTNALITFEKITDCANVQELPAILKNQRNGTNQLTLNQIKEYEEALKARVLTHLAWAMTQTRDSIPSSSADFLAFQSAIFGAVLQVQQIWMAFSEFYEEFECQQPGEKTQEE